MSAWSDVCLTSKACGLVSPVHCLARTSRLSLPISQGLVSSSVLCVRAFLLPTVVRDVLMFHPRP
eukprot:39483-Eustigmatos_ZCMA.PRE.1